MLSGPTEPSVLNRQSVPRVAQSAPSGRRDRIAHPADEVATVAEIAGLIVVVIVVVIVLRAANVRSVVGRMVLRAMNEASVVTGVGGAIASAVAVRRGARVAAVV